MFILILTIFFAFYNLIIVRYLTKRWFTPCFWYWLSWILGLIGLNISLAFGILRALDSWIEGLIVQLHVGAFFGFIFASLLFGSKSLKRLKTDDSKNKIIPKMPKWMVFFLALTFIVGLFSLAKALSKVGFSYFFDLSNVREAFILETYGKIKIPLYFRLSIYIGIISSLAIPFLALRDSKKGVIRLIL
jgi:predicted outer membrane lipoprotein